MAEAGARSGKQIEVSWFGPERLIDEVHRAETAIAALRKIDALIPNPDKPSLLAIKKIIKRALEHEV